MTAAGMLLCPIFQSPFVHEQGLLINVLYNIFILVVWCLLVELAGRTNLGAVACSEFSRSRQRWPPRSAWALATYAHNAFPDPRPCPTVFFLIMAFMLLAAMMLS